MNDEARSVTATATAEGPVRLLYIATAWLALLLALAGALLPLIPGTPFLLLAVWAAARGSRRLHDWIHAQPMLARLIDDWREQGAVPRYAKWLATLMLLASWSYLFLAGFHWAVVAGMAVFFAAVAGFIWSRPDPVRRAS